MKKNYLNQYRDPKLSYKEYVGEPLLILFICYSDMKSFYSNQVFDLRFQVDHVNLNKRLFKYFRGAPHSAHVDARIFARLFKHRDMKMISDS